MVTRQIRTAGLLSSLALGLAACPAEDDDSMGAFPPTTMSTTAAAGSTDGANDEDEESDEDEDSDDDDADDEGTTTGDGPVSTTASPTSTSTTTTTTTTNPSTTGASGGSSGWGSGSGSGGFGSGGELCTPMMTPKVCNALGAKVAECFGEDAQVEAQYCACDLEFYGGDACGMALQQYYGCLAGSECAAFDDETACGVAEVEAACQ